MKTTILTHMRRYPIGRHALCLLPTLVMLLILYFCVGSEEEVENYFSNLRHAHPNLSWWADLFSDWGNVPYYTAYSLILIRGVAKRRRADVRFALSYLVGLAAVLLLTDLMKFIIGRPRPLSDNDFDHFTTEDDNHSFPSGHMSETAYTITPLGLRYGRLLLPVFFGLSPALMALSRLAMGEHHPTDLIGALVLSASCVFIAWNARKLIVMWQAAQNYHGKK